MLHSLTSPARATSACNRCAENPNFARHFNWAFQTSLVIPICRPKSNIVTPPADDGSLCAMELEFS